MRAVGFDIRHCTSFFSTTLPLMALRRLRWRWQTFDAAAELRISKTLNIAVDALLKPEWALIRAGVSLPVGGSLLVVAERPPS
jgi:hypothetical protein